MQFRQFSSIVFVTFGIADIVFAVTDGMLSVSPQLKLNRPGQTRINHSGLLAGCVVEVVYR